MLQVDGDPGLIQEHLDEFAVIVEVLTDSLDDDQPLKAAVAELCAAKDLRHAPHGHPVEEVVLPKFLWNKARQAQNPETPGGGDPPPWPNITPTGRRRNGDGAHAMQTPTDQDLELLKDTLLELERQLTIS